MVTHLYLYSSTYCRPKITNVITTPDKFIDIWRKNTLKERNGSQSHFNQLCDLLGVIPLAMADPHGEWFTFEKGAKKTGGGDALRPRSGQGWADVWKKDCFAWEYKGKHKDLGAALRQLQQYALALDNPPLLIRLSVRPKTC